MGTFDSIYLNKIKQLQEENKRLKGLLRENEFNIHAWNAGEAWDDTELRKDLDNRWRRTLNRVEAAWEHVVTNPTEEDAHRADQARELTDEEMHKLAAAAEDYGRPRAGEPGGGGGLSDAALRDIIRRRVFDHLDKN